MESPLKLVRMQKGLTQAEVAVRVGVTQAYLSMLERGSRAAPRRLLARMAELYDSPLLLPAEDQFPEADAETLPAELAALGYPGFSYMRSPLRKNPAEVLLAALMKENLETRVAEAMPWILLKYPDLNVNWLVDQAKLRDLQNRLGFVVTLARRLAEKHNRSDARLPVFRHLETVLQRSRLAREDTLCQGLLTNAERRWLESRRTNEARAWNLLTDLKVEDVRYTA